MDGIQGAVLSVKLKRLTAWNEARRKNAALYDGLLKDVKGVTIPRKASYAQHVYHIYAICVKDRDALITALAARDIHCGIHYPIPLHLQEAYKSLGYRKGAFPVAEMAAAGFVSLPMYAELTGEQIARVASELKAIVASPVN
jgi:dTDP-4-amino-4,6-dideoxygalactose transaminase